MCDSSLHDCDWISSVLGTIPPTSAISHVSGKSLLFPFQAESPQHNLIMQPVWTSLTFSPVSLLNRIEVKMYTAAENGYF